MFFFQGWKSGAITTLGRGGSDLTATTIGKALGLQEIQVRFCPETKCICIKNSYDLIHAVMQIHQPARYYI